MSDTPISATQEVMNKILLTLLVAAFFCIGHLETEMSKLRERLDTHQDIIDIHNHIFETNNDVLDFIIDRINLNYTYYGKRMPAPEGT